MRKEWREKRPCPKCGYVRSVRLWVWSEGEAPRGGDNLCGICELKSRAANHRYWAQRFELRAGELLQRREARQKKGA